MNSDLLIKQFTINILVYLVTFKILNIKITSYRQWVKITSASVLTTITYAILKKYMAIPFLIIVSFILQNIFLSFFIKENISIFITNLVANAITYIIYTLATIIEILPLTILNINNNFCNFILITLISIILFYIFSKIKRIKNGMKFLRDTKSQEYVEIIAINISIAVIFVYTLFGNYYGNLTRHILISFIILGIIMFVMIQKTLVLYYKQKLFEKTMADYENEIKQKDEKIKVLSEEKFKISKINHEFYNRQKALEMTVNDFINNTNMEVGRELAITNKINSLSKEYSNKMNSIKQVEKLPLTGIEEIDEMFKYMQSECIKNNIDFKLKIEGNVYPLVNNIIEKDRLVTLIGDHLKDAIIAINFSKNKFKSIIAILGIKNNCYEFCVCDTGIEFQIETLLKLGLEPVTTHKETGGTGIGFISTFETLKKCNASLIIDEKHEESNNDYTKSVTIKFDGKSQYIIKSYRADKIKDKAEDDRIIIKRNDN